METARLRQNSKQRINNLDQALQLLNEAAEDSSEELRDMVSNNYHNLIGTFEDLKPVVKTKLQEVRQEVKQQAKNVDDSVHENPWIYLGSTAAISALVGFIVGRSSKD